MNLHLVSLLAVLMFAVIPASANAAQTDYDVDAKLLERPNTKPKIPGTKKESGYCCMVFDVDKSGVPQDIKTTYCTHEYLAAPMRARVRNFKYSPATRNATPVIRKDKRFQMGMFVSRGHRSNIIPGPNGYLERLAPGAKIPPRPRGIKKQRKWLKKYFNSDKPCGVLVG